MWMDLAVAGVDHQPFKVGLIYQDFKQPFPNAVVTPSDETTMSIAPAAKVRRKITPGSAGAHDPTNCIDKTPIVLGDASPFALATRQMRLQLPPNFISNVMPPMCWYCHIYLAVDEI
jgi:hypothetical protein